MNREHLAAFLWLRWRMSANQWRRAGSLNAVLMMIACVAAVALAIPAAIGAFVLGLFAIPKATPMHLMLACDAVVAVFLFSWSIGLLTDLQRSEALPLSKFLHLPVSIRGAFLINYVSSLLKLSLVLFVPVMLGFSAALVFTLGARMLFVFALLAAFLLMITSLTYQFQGWLASLMSNPRRRRSVVVLATVIFIAIAQLPQLVNVYAMRGFGQQQKDRAATYAERTNENNRALTAGEISLEEHQRRQQELNDALQGAAREKEAGWERAAGIANMVIPFGWLPLGIKTAADGHTLLSLLACSGMALIGAASLGRAYVTTMNLYRGTFTAGKEPPKPAVGTSAAETTKSRFLERRLPGTSEQVSVIALATWRGLIRAPESKMMLLSPLIMGVMFGSVLLRGPQALPEPVRPLLALGGVVFTLFGIVQLMANQFGFDRDGFRVFVLSSASRRDILLGKNLAFGGMGLVMVAVTVAAIQALCPARLDHFLAIIPQSLSMFLAFCLLMNCLSILGPMRIAAGAMKPANLTFLPILIQMLALFVAFPLTQLPLMIPLAVDLALPFLGIETRVPVYLLLALVECGLMIWLYRLLIDWQGNLLQAREQKILETVTSKGGGA